MGSGLRGSGYKVLDSEFWVLGCEGAEDMEHSA